MYDDFRTVPSVADRVEVDSSTCSRILKSEDENGMIELEKVGGDTLC